MIWTLITILLTVALVLGWRERPGLSLPKRVVLLALRLGAIIILGLVLLDMFPRLLGRERRSLLVITDASQSMTLNDGRPQSRWQRAVSIVRSLKLPDAGRTIHRTTGEGISEGLSDSLKDHLVHTDLNEALALSLKKKPGAILLLSDGNNNHGDDPVRAAAAGIPVYVIGLGPTGGLKNALIADILGGGQIEAGQPAEISLSLKGTLSEGRASLWEKGAKLAEKRLDLKGDTVVTFTVVPTTEGVHRYTATLSNSGNQKMDQIALAVSVVKKKFKLLCICPEPDWNLRFWSQAISNDPAYATDIMTKQGSGWKMHDHGGQAVSAGFDSLDKYDAIVLGNYQPGDIQETVEQGIADLVRQKGRGLFLLGSVRQGGVIGRLAPISYSREVKPASGTARPAPELFITGMLDVSKEAEFKRLPPLTLEKNYVLRDDNVLLLASLQTPDKKNHPLWARVSAGAGRVMQISSEDLWRWRLAAAGAGRDTALFGEMVQRSLKWVLGGEDSGIEAGPERILNAQGQTVKFIGKWGNNSRTPDQKARWSVVIADVSGRKMKYELADWGTGNYVAELASLSVGQYDYAAILEFGGKQIHTVRGKFYVEPGRDELRDHLQNGGLLRSLAAVSGGQYWDEGKLPENGGWQKDIKIPAVPGTSQENPVFSILAVCLLLSTEWFLLRKWGRA